jgi:photosystem II oxygen-evolving enhancer protein 1
MRFRPLLAIALALCLTLVTACGGGAEAKSRSNVTYDDIVNTGRANDCPTLPMRPAAPFPSIPPAATSCGKSACTPLRCYVKGEPQNKRQEARFVEGRILTRYTSSLDQIYGDLKVGDDSLTFTELGGIDFQPVTVLLPGGEEVPFTFSSKELVATSVGAAISTSTDFTGSYRTPSYRTSNFLDPKGRGLTTGYGSAVGLVPAGDDEELIKENVKRYIEGKGSMELAITKVDPSTGEFSGSSQPSSLPTPTWAASRPSMSRSPASSTAGWKKCEPWGLPTACSKPAPDQRRSGTLQRPHQGPFFVPSPASNQWPGFASSGPLGCSSLSRAMAWENSIHVLPIRRVP